MLAEERCHMAHFMFYVYLNYASYYIGLKAIDLAVRNRHKKCKDILAEYHLHYCTSSEFDSVLFLATLEVMLLYSLQFSSFSMYVVVSCWTYKDAVWFHIHHKCLIMLVQFFAIVSRVTVKSLKLHTCATPTLPLPAL